MATNSCDSIIDEIMSYDIFSKLDKDMPFGENALIDKFSFSNLLKSFELIFEHKIQPRLQSDSIISKIPPEGILISNPGTYSFSSDLTWEPGTYENPAITISGNHIILDLKSFSLTAAISDNSKQLAGILVHKNSSQVTVRNGTLQNMTYYGIHADHVDQLILEKLTVDSMTFCNIDSACPAGIIINNSQCFTVSDCRVENLAFTAGSSAGIQIVSSTGGTVENCHVKNMVNNDGSVQGFSCVMSSCITTANCSADGFTSHYKGETQTMGHTVLGFIPMFCVNLAYVDCKATNMTGCCDDCHGMSIFLDAKVTVVNFTADHVVDGIAPCHTGAKATGLEVYGISVSVVNCQVSNITAIRPQDLQSTGFSAWGRDISFTNCKACNIKVIDENGNKNPVYGYGTGFGWAPDVRLVFRTIGAENVRYVKCGAENCQVGFDTWNHINSIWENICYSECDENILVQPNGTRVLSGDKCSECDPPFSATVENIARNNSYPRSQVYPQSGA